MSHPPTNQIPRALPPVPRRRTRLDRIADRVAATEFAADVREGYATACTAVGVFVATFAGGWLTLAATKPLGELVYSWTVTR